MAAATETKREVTVTDLVVAKAVLPLWRTPRDDDPNGDVAAYRQYCGLDYYENWDPSTAELYTFEAKDAAKKAKAMEKKVNKKGGAAVVDDNGEETKGENGDLDDESDTIPPYIQPNRSNPEVNSQHDNGPYIVVKCKRFGSGDLEDISVKGCLQLVQYSTLGVGNWKGGYPEGKAPSYPVAEQQKAEVSVCLSRTKSAYLKIKPGGAALWEEYQRMLSWSDELFAVLKSKVMDSQSSIFIETARGKLCTDMAKAALVAKQQIMSELSRDKSKGHITDVQFSEGEKKATADYKAAPKKPTRRQVIQEFEKTYTRTDSNIKTDTGSLMKLGHKLFRYARTAEKNQPQFEGFKTIAGRTLACRTLPAVMMGGLSGKGVMMDHGMIIDLPSYYVLSDDYPKKHPWYDQKLASGSVAGFKYTVRIRQSYEHLSWRMCFDFTEIHFYQYPPPPDSMDPSLLQIEMEPEEIAKLPPRIKFGGAHPIGGPVPSPQLLEYHPPEAGGVVVNMGVLTPSNNNKRKESPPPAADEEEEEEDNFPPNQLSPTAKRARGIVES